MKRKIDELNRIQIILSTILILWLGGCASDSNSSKEDLPSKSLTPETQTDEAIVLSQTCSNNDVGYQISYPQEWQTNSGKVLARCQVFDPQSAIVPENTESTDKAIYLRVEQVPFDLVATENKSERHLSRQMFEIGNFQAVAVESEFMGDGLLPKGTRTYSYIIDLNNSILIAITYDLAGDRYQTNKQVLDRMMKTIEFTNR